MSYIDIQKRFQQGSAGAAQAQEINDIAQSAKDSGIDVTSHMDAINQSLAHNDNAGFQQNIYSLKNHVTQQANAIAAKKSAEAIDFTLRNAKKNADLLGLPLNTDQISEARDLLKQGSIEQARVLADSLTKNQELAGLDIAKTKAADAEKRNNENVAAQTASKSEIQAAQTMYTQLGNLADNPDKFNRIFGASWNMTGGSYVQSPMAKSAMDDLSAIQGTARKLAMKEIKGSGSISDAEGAAAAASMIALTPGTDEREAMLKIRRLQALSRDKWDTGYYNKWLAENKMQPVVTMAPASATQSVASNFNAAPAQNTQGSGSQMTDEDRMRAATTDISNIPFSQSPQGQQASQDGQ